MISAIAVAFVFLGTAGQPVLSQDAVEQPADETIFAYLPPSVWAQTLSQSDRSIVRKDDIRPVACVGLESTYMLCAWEQRIEGEWLRLSQYADVGQIDGAPIRLIGEREPAPRSDLYEGMTPGLGEGEWVVPDHPLIDDIPMTPPR